MIHCIKGELLSKSSDELVIMCSGVGFKISVATGTLSKVGTVGEDVIVYTYLNVKDDALDLYGFLSEEELFCFRLLISVSGIGPRLGLSILSTFSPEKIFLAIASGDYKLLTACSGVGAKTAQRIILELKDKVSSIEIESFKGSEITGKADGDLKRDAIAALTSLGFSTSEATLALSKLADNMTLEDMVAAALKSLSNRRK
ncbi:MAG: Holliday junction branch migration protein RuvA [Ruminococcaceae bacterium]|nr:Holliday junction branch migration protein RuvA [Oscillospiraceae bacterium]